ncbi:LPS-assembly protein LptD [Desulfonatronovibrio magnus]|uniref:LPS-assembly protein LptD n=1 Tax=Desulfonatronovibrio magnus TaxID=698827 RepID=UPI000698AB27|nr:LPS assembly protein LptD [Desulfonatronovibrio magnus]
MKTTRLILLITFFTLLHTFDFSHAEVPWHLEAQRLTSHEGDKIIEAFDDVYLHRQDNFLQADYARLHTETSLLYLKGNIRAYWDGDYLEGQEAEFDLEHNVGWITHGQIFVAKEHVYFTGEKLKKLDENTYTFVEGSMTSCDGERPPWSIVSTSGRINVDGYATMRHPRLRIKDQSVFYAPYMIVPVKTERQSGFLLPDVGYGSEYGTNINLPYYWAIDEQRDATIYANYYSKRGLMTGLEYRHTPSLLSKGLWRLDWLNDREKHDTPESKPRRFRDDGMMRDNTDRYWLRGKYDGHHPESGWFYKLDLDYVSDHYYLREFKSGISGFDNSRNEFLKKFGRDIDDHNSFIRTNIVSATRYWTNVGLDTRLVYSDNLRHKNDNLPSSLNPTVQRLPELNLNLFRTNLGQTPLELEAAAQGVYFWREYGTRAGRFDVHPRLSSPLRNNFGTLTPSIGWRQTLWAIDRFENEPSERDTDNSMQTRGLYDININAFTSLHRIFELNSMPEPSLQNLGMSKWTRIQHSVRPEIDFDYIPNVNQEKHPVFDSSDRIEPREELTYSLSNVFTRRSDTVVPGDSSTGPALSANYLDFFRIKFEQSYDFREARRSQDLETYSRRPFSDILAETTVFPGKWVNLRNKTWYSPYENRITEHEHTLTMNWPQKASAWFSLDFLEKIDEYKRRINSRTSIMEIGTTLEFIPNWQFNLTYRRDLEFNEDVERGVGIFYQHQCYSIRFKYTESDFDRKFEVRLNLLNLGTFGG